MLTKRKFIYSLVVVSISLIVLNILFEITSKKETKTDPEISINEIESKFSATLNCYGIISDWIKKVYVKKKLSDSLDFLYNVTFPDDVSMPAFIKDLNNSFDSKLIRLETIERKNHSNTQLRIFYNKKLKLQANLRDSKNIRRKYAAYSFLVHFDLKNDELFLKEIENIFHDFTFLISPSKKAIEMKDRFKEKYALLINDELNGTEYSLEEDFSKQKLTNRIRSIVINFGNDKTYLIDETSAIFNSKIYNLLDDEFEKRGINLISLQQFPKLKGNSNKELTSLFMFYTTSLKGKEKKTFIINSSDFLELQTLIDKQIKLGDKVLRVNFD